jgi:hypothetical protein
MAKMITVSKAEHEMLVAAYAQDGMTIAKLEAELKQAKEDIKRLLEVGTGHLVCDFCKCKPESCGGDCELNAEWRGMEERR